MTTLLVGADKAALFVDKALICTRSEVFRKAFSSDLSEGRTGVMELPEEDVKTVGNFIRWTHSGDIDFLYLEDHVDDDSWEVNLQDGVGVLSALGLFLFAEKYMINELKHQCWRRLRGLQKHNDRRDLIPHFTYEQLFDAWKLARHSRIRFIISLRYLQQLLVDGAWLEWPDKLADPAFLLDAMFVLHRSAPTYGGFAGPETWKLHFPNDMAEFFERLTVHGEVAEMP